MKKYILLWIMALVLISSASANSMDIVGMPDRYLEYEGAVNVHFYVYNSSGFRESNSSVDCVLHLYNTTGGRIVNSALSYGPVTQTFYYSLTSNETDEMGLMAYMVQCNSSSEQGYLNGEYEITRDGNAWPLPSGLIVAIILLPLMVSLIALFGAATMDEEHDVLRIFLFLFSGLPIFLSIALALEALYKFYNFGLLEQLLGTFIPAWGIPLAMITIYFILYGVWKITRAIWQKKKARLEY